MILIISTANKESILLILAEDEKKFWVKEISAERKQSEKLLVSVLDFLKKKSCQLEDVVGMGVVSGPGGFTSLRIGVVTANTLAYALKIPIVGVVSDEFSDHTSLVMTVFNKLNNKKSRLFNLAENIVLPFYDREPNITYRHHIPKLDSIRR